MKKLFNLVLVALMVLAVGACTNKNQSQSMDQSPKSLVLYYSQEGTTKAVAEEIARLTGADICAISLKEPYNGDYQATISRVNQERLDSVLPALEPLAVDPDDYETIYLGYPIWFGTYAPPVAALVAETDFAGKRVVPFCTFGSGGLEVSVADLKAALPKAEIADGYGVRAARKDAIPAEVERFLIEGGYIDGEVEALPEFGEQRPVTDADTAIFDAACGDYQFPLGTPVTVSERALADATEYRYEVNARGFDGSDTTCIIYVIAPAGDAKPVFTRVVR